MIPLLVSLYLLIGFAVAVQHTRITHYPEGAGQFCWFAFWPLCIPIWLTGKAINEVAWRLNVRKTLRDRDKE